MYLLLLHTSLMLPFKISFFFPFVKLHYFAFMNALCMFLSLSNKNILHYFLLNDFSYLSCVALMTTQM